MAACFAIEIVDAAIAKIVVDPISNLVFLDNNFRSLQEEVKKVIAARDRMRHSTDYARLNEEIVTEEAKHWLSNVDEFLLRFSIFSEEVEELNRRRLCPHLLIMHRLARRQVRYRENVLRFLEGEKSMVLSQPAPPLGIATLSKRNYEAFESRRSISREILDALIDNENRRIGVYGPAGIGKTMLVKEVAKLAELNRFFDEVVIATVSENPNVGKIQGEIADMLGLQFIEVSEPERARRLFSRLRNQKTLIILDDVCGFFSLESIGIPSGSEDEGCKLLITSRNQNLHFEMITEKIFKVGVLTEEESWNYFRKKAGDSVEISALKPIAIDVAKHCAGLPIATAAIAKALKDKSLFVWEDALQQLRNSTPRNIQGMREKVYIALELSQKRMEGTSGV